MSPTTKLLVASLEVKVIASVESFELAPSETSAEVMAIVGEVVSSETSKSQVLLLSLSVNTQPTVPEMPDFVGMFAEGISIKTEL